jgi:hypothetical protein
VRNADKVSASFCPVSDTVFLTAERVIGEQWVFERIFLPIVDYALYDNKEAKASEALVVSGPRMSENTHCSTAFSIHVPYFKNNVD